VPSFVEISKVEVIKTMRGIPDRQKILLFAVRPILRGLWSDLAENFIGSLFPTPISVPLPSFVQIDPISEEIQSMQKCLSDSLQYRLLSVLLAADPLRTTHDEQIYKVCASIPHTSNKYPAVVFYRKQLSTQALFLVNNFHNSSRAYLFRQTYNQ